MTLARCLLKHRSSELYLSTPAKNAILGLYAGNLSTLQAINGERSRLGGVRDFTASPGSNVKQNQPIGQPKPQKQSSGLGRSFLFTVLLGSAVGAGGYYWWYLEKGKWGPGPVLSNVKILEVFGKNGIDEKNLKESDVESSQVDSEKAALEEISGELTNDLGSKESALEKVNENDDKGIIGEAPEEAEKEGKTRDNEVESNEATKTYHETVKETNEEVLTETNEDKEGNEEKIVEKGEELEDNLDEELNLVLEAADNQKREETVEEVVSKEKEHKGDESVAAMAADLVEEATKVLEKEQEAEKQGVDEIATNSVQIPDLDSRFEEARDKISVPSLTTLSQEAAVKYLKENSGVKAEEISEIARREMAEDEREKLFSKKAYYLIREAVQAQAEVDSEAFSEELENLKAQQKQELREAIFNLELKEKQVSELNDEIEKLKSEFQSNLSEEKRRSEEIKEKELLKKAKEAEEELIEAKLLAEATLEAQIAFEKTESLKNLSEFEIQLKALNEAFFHKSEESRKSHTAHKLALSSFALEESSSKGLPLGVELETLKKSTGEDPLIIAVLDSLPEEVSRNKVPTTDQLKDKLERMKVDILVLSNIPKGQRGLLALGVAKLAAFLKVSEDGTELPGGGPEVSISQAQKFLSEGQILRAAQILTDAVLGTEAEEFVEIWAKDAKNRAIVDQAIAVINAHAISLTSSLS